MLFSTTIKVTISAMTNLVAGDAIMLYFPKTTDEEPEIDDRMSGIYIITSATSKFSGGMYTTDITAFQNQAYNMARIVAVKKVVDQRVSEYMSTIGDQTIGSGGQGDIEESQVGNR